MKNPAYTWCDDSFETKEQVEDAVAHALVDHLCDGDAGSVEHGEFVYCIEVKVRLVNKSKQ